MAKHFLGKTVLILTAHPDDEHLIAGTMYENYKAGGKTVLVCATYGERGKSHLKRPVTDAAMKKIRKAELLKAAKILHVDQVVFLGLPDAGLKKNAKALLAKMSAIADKVKPDQILSFGPDGISAHLDHITVGAAARKIAKRLKIPLAAFTFHPEIARHRYAMLLPRRKFGMYADVIEFRPGDIRIPIEAEIKQRVMDAHTSQLKDGGWVSTLPRGVARQFFKQEHFVTEQL